MNGNRAASKEFAHLPANMHCEIRRRDRACYLDGECKGFSVSRRNTGSRSMGRNRSMWCGVDRDRAQLHRARRAHEVGLRARRSAPGRARFSRQRNLLQDTDEAAYYEIDKKRPLSFEEIKSDLVLCNGARFYNDHAHPEYSTPECTTLREIVAQDKAGERILAECARRRNSICRTARRRGFTRTTRISSATATAATTII